MWCKLEVDLFKHNSFWLGQLAFGEAFPEVKTIQVDIKQDLGHWIFKTERERSIRMSEVNMKSLVPCGDRSCIGGGLYLEPEIQTLVDARGSELDWTASCNGTVSKQECLNRFAVNLRITY